MANGLVCAIPPQRSGKTQLTYMISNRYFKGEPFPRKEKTKEKKEEEKEVCAKWLLHVLKVGALAAAAQSRPLRLKELCDLEIERQRNIARNQELLRMLGLA